MLAAVEGPAQERTALVNRTAGGTEIDAGAVRFGGEKIDRISGGWVGADLKPIGLHVVALLRMEKKPLIALAAFGAGFAGDLSVLVRVRHVQS